MMEIKGRRVDAETEELLRRALQQMDGGVGVIEEDLEDLLDDRMTRAYITGDDDLCDYIENLLNASYENEQKGYGR